MNDIGMITVLNDTLNIHTSIQKITHAQHKMCLLVKENGFWPVAWLILYYG
jgi:hypothetical protein